MSILRFLGIKKKNSAIKTSKDPISFTQDAKLCKMLSELKSVALRIEGTFHSCSTANDFHKPYLMQYNNFCCQIEDALEVFEQYNFSDNPLQTVNPSNVAKDFAEGFANRYGELFASRISLLVSNELPIVRANPGKLIRFIDCIARSSFIHRPESNVKIFMSLSNASKNLSTNDEKVEINISFSNIGLAVDANRAHQLIKEFYQGDYSNTLNVLGIEFCAALHIAYRLQAAVQVNTDSSGVNVLEVSFPLEISKTGVYPVSQSPASFYVYSKSKEVRATLKSIAEFEKQKAYFIGSVSAVPEKYFLVYDATTFSDSTLADLKQLKSPEKTVVILPNYDLQKMRTLAQMGFCFFISIPIVSSQLFYCIHQSSFVRYKPQSEISKNISDKKLRVLIVDDTTTARIVLRDYFESQGHAVVEASDGHEFVNYIEQGEKFDIVFCDQTMSYMDGVTATKKVREYEHKNGGNTPIILITAYDSLDKEVDLSFFDRILKKPVAINKIEQALNAFVFSDYVPNKHQMPLPVTDTQIIDLEDLRERCSGKEKTMIRVLESFMESAITQLSKLDNSETLSNQDTLKKTIHTIKGLFRDAGATSGAEFIKEIEEKLKNSSSLEDGDLKAIKELVHNARDSAAVIKNSLQQ